MMRSRWRSLAGLTVCGALVVGASAAGASRTAQGAKAAGRVGRARPITRTWNLTLSPAPNDVALAEISFHRAHLGARISGRMLRVSVNGTFGADYMALATPVVGTPGDLRALVAVVNRPSALMDPADVHLRITARQGLGTPVVWKLANPFSQPHPGLTPALCDLPVHGSTVSGADLLALGSRGAAPAGFGVGTTVAQAYDVACGLPYEGAFAQAVTGAPAPRPPICMPCAPPPGYACPAVQPSICELPVAAAAGRASAGAHYSFQPPAPFDPCLRRTARPMSETHSVETDQAVREASGAHPYGRYLEEFEVGAVYKHWPAKTVTESDDHLFCLITMNHHPLHLNDVYAGKSQQGRNVVVGPLVYSLALGMSVSDVSGKAIANLATEELKHPAPVFHGDTLFCESEVLEKRESQSKPDRGTVKVHTRVLNQDGVLVAEFKRLVLVPRKTPASASAEGDVE